MSIHIYPKNTLGNAKYGWLNTHYHFSFANYYNPERMGFGTLRVINDDIIAPNTGFDFHPHRNMEIITCVKTGAITHKDNQGNDGKTQAGDVQVMSAGSGIVHSEWNTEDTPTTLLQIWIEPNQHNVTPRWDTAKFPAASNALTCLVSNDNTAPLHIHQNAKIYAGSLTAGTTINHTINHQLYIVGISGTADINGQTLNAGDGAEITNQSTVTLTATTSADILLLDVP